MFNSNKVFLIISREYLSRVKKKSFIIMSLLGPIILSLVFFAKFLLNMIPEEQMQVSIVDETHLFESKLNNNKTVQFYNPQQSLKEAKQTFYKDPYHVLVYIPENMLSGQHIEIYYKKQPSFSTIEYIKDQCANRLQNLKLLANGLSNEKLSALKSNINAQAIQLNEEGKEEKSNSKLSLALGFTGGMLIYIFIFLYGAQVMRGVMEEKTSRIIEVIMCTVKPFELMLGKIIGVALVGLTQFLIWIVLFLALSQFGNMYLENKNFDSKNISQVEQTFTSNMPSQEKENVKEIQKEALTQVLSQLNLPVLFGMFLFFFLGGYLLYGALFAAIGAAVDSETDTQQFMMPITVPLILAIVVAQVIMTNPTSKLAFWFSIFPFTSPVVMMVRIPFGVPMLDLVLSIVFLILGFIFTTYLAAKIYRIGILMYGKKVTFKELAKWIKYS
jgi:ABC-2 type transport system permease protein